MNGAPKAMPQLPEPHALGGQHAGPVDHHPIQQRRAVGQQPVGDHAAQRQADHMPRSGGDAALDEANNLPGGVVQGGPGEVVAPAVPGQIRGQAVRARQPAPVLVPHPAAGAVGMQNATAGDPGVPDSWTDSSVTASRVVTRSPLRRPCHRA
jgi:hypothetical protein